LVVFHLHKKFNPQLKKLLYNLQVTLQLILAVLPTFYSSLLHLFLGIDRTIEIRVFKSAIYLQNTKLASSKGERTSNAEAQTMGESKLHRALLPVSLLASNNVNAHKNFKKVEVLL